MSKGYFKKDRIILVNDDGEATAQILSWGKERKIIGEFLELNRDLLGEVWNEVREAYLSDPVADFPLLIPIYDSATKATGYLTLWMSWDRLPQVSVGFWADPEAAIDGIESLWFQISTWRDRAVAFNREKLGGLEPDPERWIKVMEALRERGKSYSEIAEMLEQEVAGLLQSAMRSYVATRDSHLPDPISLELVSLLGTFGYSLDDIVEYLKQISKELAERQWVDMFPRGRLITGDKVREKLRYRRKKREK